MKISKIKTKLGKEKWEWKKKKEWLRKKEKKRKMTQANKQTNKRKFVFFKEEEKYKPQSDIKASGCIEEKLRILAREKQLNKKIEKKEGRKEKRKEGSIYSSLRWN